MKEHAMKRVVIATNNAHKVEEIRTALNFDGWEFFTLTEAGVESAPAEDADDFLGNARIKARAACDALHAGGFGPCAVLADDSGLVVDALDGAPGVFSSRYAGEDGNDEANNAKLLEELSKVPSEKRSARFVCMLVFLDEDGSETVAQGTVEGHIAHRQSGSEGFGYDPLFLPDALDGTTTMAQITQEQKNSMSHRGNALRELYAALKVKL